MSSPGSGGTQHPAANARDNKIQRTVREIKIKNTRRRQPHRL